MNIVDFLLSSYFTNFNGIQTFDEQKEIRHGDFDTIASIFLSEKDPEGLMGTLVKYEGPNYREAVELAVQFDRFDIAMDISLKYKDYELCDLIYNEESRYIQESLGNSFYEKRLNEEYEINENGYTILTSEFGMSHNQVIDFIKDILNNPNNTIHHFNQDGVTEIKKDNNEDEYKC